MVAFRHFERGCSICSSRVHMPGALSSLKIIELGEMVSAPYAGKLMADMGAEVVKIERPPIGDKARTRGPFPGGSPHPEKSGQRSQGKC